MSDLKALPSFRERVSLRDYCTLGIGGAARFFIEVTQTDQLSQALRYCNTHNLSFHILGKGSNTLFPDSGFDGLVIYNKIDFVERNEETGIFKAGAGANFALLGVQTARAGFTGLEFACGIPASVGGAVYMNAGAAGSEVCQVLTEVDFVDYTGELHSLKKEDIDFSYRYSSFQKRRGAIASATFSLKRDTAARQRQLEMIKYRTNTQPYHEKSAGCIFKNPADGSAGSLIEQCGLKGLFFQGAAVSDMHANFLVNREAANAQTFQSLIAHVQSVVKEKTGIDLHPEIRVIQNPGEHV